MTSRVPVSVMVFTLNEEVHIPACLASLAWTDDVIVVDSFSTDRTRELCLAAGARFFQNRFEGFGKQRMWGLAKTSPKYDWILILDADERVTPELAEELARAVPAAPADVAAFRVKRRFFMWGRWLKHSSTYPSWVVRLVRQGRVEYVNRGHAETQAVDGKTLSLLHDLVDENIKGIDEWFERQNRYSSREAEYEVTQLGGPLPLSSLGSRDPLTRRAAIKSIAARVPLRPWIYFVYSYLLRGGFLDGRDGLVFCIMKAEYYRMVAIKKYDLRRARRA